MRARPSPFALGAGPVGLAHRGGALEGVENSPSAFQRAVDLGFAVIETDIRATVDGHAVVLHDATLDRTTDRTGPVSALPLTHVRGSRLRNGEHPMTLLEALRRWPGVTLNVDIKADDAVEPFLRAVEDAGAWHRVCAASFSTARIRRIRALAGPRLATSLATTEVVRLRLRVPTGAADVACAVQVPERSGPVRVVTRGFVRHAHDLGLAVHVWTVNEADAMHRLLDLGVDGIVTDRPSVLAKVLSGGRGRQ